LGAKWGENDFWGERGKIFGGVNKELGRRGLGKMCGAKQKCGGDISCAPEYKE